MQRNIENRKRLWENNLLIPIEVMAKKQKPVEKKYRKNEKTEGKRERVFFFSLFLWNNSSCSTSNNAVRLLWNIIKREFNFLLNSNIVIVQCIAIKSTLGPLLDKVGPVSVYTNITLRHSNLWTPCRPSTQKRTHFQFFCCKNAPSNWINFVF